MKARAIGIPAPAVWAVAERRRGGILLGSCLVRPWVEGAVTASSILLDAGGEPAADALAEALRRWHDAGFRHGDCYPKNVLVDPTSLAASPIGCPAASFPRAGAQADKARWKDLAQWLVGLELLHAVDAAERFVGVYRSREPGMPGEAAMLELIATPRARILEKKAARIASLPDREPHGPPAPTPLPPPSGGPDRQVRPLHRLVPARRGGPGTGT